MRLGGRLLSPNMSGMGNDDALLTIDKDVLITGDLTIQGEILEEMRIVDNVIVLNHEITGTPSDNAGIEVERGTSANASILWNETDDIWLAGISGSERRLVLGPTFSTDNALPRWDGATGNILQNSAVTIDDYGILSINAVYGGNLVSNGTFNADLTGWAGANWAWNAGSGNGMALHTIGATTALTQAALAGVVGTEYYLSVTTRNMTAGWITIGIGGQISAVITTNTTTNVYLTATSTGVLTIAISTDFDGGVDDINVMVVSYGSLTVDNGILMKSGQLIVSPGSATYPAITSLYDSDTGIFFNNAALNSVNIACGGNPCLRVASGSSIYITTLCFSSSAAAAAEMQLTREAANVLGIHNSTTAQTINLYATRTTYGSNYEMLQLLTAAGSFTMQALSAGATGSANIDINIYPKGTGAVNTGAYPIKITEMTAPTGVANKATIFAQDNGAGKTQLMVIFGSGVAQQIAIEP